MRYHGELPKSHKTSASDDRRGAATKLCRNSVGAIVELKQDGQTSNDGQCGKVSQSLRPRVNVVRGQAGSGTTSPRSKSSE